MALRVACSLSLAGLLLFVTGCYSRAGPSNLQFTPDSTGLVYEYDEGLAVGICWFGGGIGAGAGKVELCWVDTPGATELSRVLLDKSVVTPLTQLMLPPRHVRARPTHFVIAPDSRHAAYLRSRGDIVIMSRDGRRQVLEDASMVSRIAWISPNELAYAETPDVGDEKEVTIWRQALPGSSQRRLVYRSPAYGWRTDWSPTGKYVLVRPTDGPKVLDIASGQTIDLEISKWDLRDATWSPDGKKLLLLVWDKPDGHDPPYHLRYVVIVPETGRRVEWTQVYEHMPTLGWGWGWHPSEWTADSRYVSLEYHEDNLILLDTENNETIDVVELLSEHLRRQNVEKVYSVGGLPVPGWLSVIVQVKGEKLNRVFAADYTGRHFVQIPRGPKWTVSPDGKYVADLNAEGQVHIRELHLPPLADTQGIASQAAEPHGAE